MFLGHSDFLAKSNDENKMLALLENLCKNVQTDFYLGGYGNFDRFALNCTKKFKEKHPQSRIIYITPYLNINKDSYEKTTEIYDEIIFPEIETAPLKIAIIKRNQWIIKNSDFIVAYLERKWSEAATSVRYAYKIQKPVINTAEYL